MLNIPRPVPIFGYACPALGFGISPSSIDRNQHSPHMPTAPIMPTDQFGFAVGKVVVDQPTRTSAVDVAGPVVDRQQTSGNVTSPLGAMKSLDAKACEELADAIQSSEAATDSPPPPKRVNPRGRFSSLRQLALKRHEPLSGITMQPECR